MSPSHRYLTAMLCAVIATLVLSSRAMAYAGPGAGMEYFGYVLSLAAMIGAAFLSIFLWPFYAALRWLRGTKTPTTAEQPAATPVAATPVADTPPAPPAPASPPDQGQATPSS